MLENHVVYLQRVKRNVLFTPEKDNINFINIVTIKEIEIPVHEVYSHVKLFADCR